MQLPPYASDSRHVRKCGQSALPTRSLSLMAASPAQHPSDRCVSMCSTRQRHSRCAGRRRMMPFPAALCQVGEQQAHLRMPAGMLFDDCPLEPCCAPAALVRLASVLPSPVAEAGLLDHSPPLEEMAGPSFGEPYTNGEHEFELRVAPLGRDAPSSRRRFAERLQSLFAFCIETSSPIDDTDDRWSVLSLFQRPSSAEAPSQLVAACTLFCFKRWVAGSGPAVLLRVCQARARPPASPLSASWPPAQPNTGCRHRTCGFSAPLVVRVAHTAAAVSRASSSRRCRRSAGRATARGCSQPCTRTRRP